MTQFFIGLYDYFERHKILFYLSLISCVLLMGFFALQVRFEENITQFFPDTKDSQNTIKVFDNLKIKDKIIIMLSSADTCHRVEPNSLIEAAAHHQRTGCRKILHPDRKQAGRWICHCGKHHIHRREYCGDPETGNGR